MRKSRSTEEQIIKMLKEHVAGLSMTHARRDCAMPNDCSDIAYASWTNSFHASIKSWIARATRPARNG
jgi:hypothetical protein